MCSLAKFAKEKVTVCLTGNAGDELFGGYERYRRALLARYVLGRRGLFARVLFIKDPLLESVLEERMPLCDKELAALARSLPRRYKVDLFGTKKVLKDAFKDDLPEYLFNQPKRGWFAPAAKWLRNPEFSRLARDVLSPGYCAGTASLFNWPAVADMLERHIDKREYNLTLLWTLITFQTWAKEYKIELCRASSTMWPTCVY